MKMFNTSNVDIVKSCQLHFNFDMPSTLWGMGDFYGACMHGHITAPFSRTI